MIRLDMENCSMVLTGNQQKYEHYHAKMIEEQGKSRLKF